jgi:hypothetical protein
MTRTPRSSRLGDKLKADAKKLAEATEHSPGIYEVMRLYTQYQKVLEQSRAYLVHPIVVTSFSSSDRTG